MSSMRPAVRGRLDAAAVEILGPGLRRAGIIRPGRGSLGSTATDGEGTGATKGVVAGGDAITATSTTTAVATAER